MRTRTPVELVLRHLLWLAVIAAGIGCDKNPAAPSPPPDSPPAVSIRSLAIDGNLSLRQPGDTGTLTAFATFTDGSGRDVTDAAEWTSTGSPGLLTVANGKVTARQYGSGSISVRYGTTRQETPVRVGPEGAFFIQGTVVEAGSRFGVIGATVEVTSMAGVYRAMTDTSGSGAFTLPAAGAATLRVSKGGYDDAARQLSVERDEQVAIELQRRQQAGDVTGSTR
jgi:hypothetical protein